MLCTSIVFWVQVRVSRYSDKIKSYKKQILIEHNKTGKWLADELGKLPCTVSKWCQNSIQPDIKTLSEIAKLLDVDVKDLLVSNKKSL